MGGLGALVAFFVLSSLYRRSRTLPFDLEALLLVSALLVVLLVVRERHLSQLYQPGHAYSAPPVDRASRGVLPAVRLILHNRDRSVLFLLLAVMAWIAAVTGAQAMFTRYGVQQLKMDPSGAAVLLGIFAGAFLAFALPAGAIGDRIGRLVSIRLGGAATLVVFVSIAAAHDLALIRPLLVIGGIGWALIIVNAYPLLVDRVQSPHTATYTGLWNAALGLAGLLSPLLYGFAVDRWGFGAFFTPGIIFAGAGLVSTLGIAASTSDRTDRPRLR
jgi:predicted MFS family arabinose efflux permease